MNKRNGEPKNVLILGSTGTIGRNTLDVIGQYPDRFRVWGLTAFCNAGMLATQVAQYRPKHAAIGTQGMSQLQQSCVQLPVQIYDAERDVAELVASPEVDIVVIGMSGSAALAPFLAAVRAGKRVAPANKEALVIAGDTLMREAAQSGSEIIPIDSEQSAIFQCFQGQERKSVRCVYLTASGGALHNVAAEKFDALDVEDILRHPRWTMGKKITVDSATLMNKGFEVIEALRLFSLDVEQIRVIVHPEAIIHSLVSFQDGSLLAQLGDTDMRLPIQYALTYPERLASPVADVDLVALQTLTFCPPDLQKFPCLELAFDVAKTGGTLCSVLNAADEVAVEAYLQRKITLRQIYDTLAQVTRRHRNQPNPDIEQVLAADEWARQEGRRVIASSSRSFGVL